MKFGLAVATHVARRLAPVLAVLLLNACGSSPTVPARVEPDLRSPSPTPSAESALIVSGLVTDTAGRRLSGVTLTVVDGARAGLTTVSGDEGQFDFPERIPYPSTIRATLAGYVDQAKTYTLRTSVNAFVTFVLESARRAPLNLTGTYVVTFTAAASCNLPDVVRTRTYTATIGGSAWTYSIALGGSSFVDGANRLEALVFEDFVRIRFAVGVSEDGSIDGGIQERVGANAILVVTGNAEGVATEHDFDLVFNGEFWFGEYACASTNNRVTFRRQ